MCSSDVPAPDPAIGQAAHAQAEVAKEALDWYKQQYADQAGQRAKVNQYSNAVAEQQLAAAKQNQEIANDYWNQRNAFKPVEQGLIRDAQNYDTPQRREMAAGDAMAQVHSAYGQQRDNTMRNMASMGINPASGAYQATMAKTGAQEAANTAAAGNQARQLVEQQGWARRSDVANLGRNLMSAQATSQGLSGTMGNSAVNNAMAAGNFAQNQAGLMGAGYQTFQNGTNAAINGLNSAYQNQLSSYNAQNQAANGVWSSVGTLAGLFI